MSWLLCCVNPEASCEARAAKKCAHGLAKPGSPSKRTTGDSLPVCLTSSLERREASLNSRPPFHITSSKVRKASQHGLRLSEDTVMSALSSSPTSINPLAYMFPFVNDDNEEFSTGNTREESDALGSTAAPQTRSKVDFADLCGSLEDLVYVGEGSNGAVYSAFWHGARVAVKFLLGNRNDNTHLQRCLTEAVLTRVLSHPCVVQCFATAIAQLTPEIWEAISARCRLHQSLLKSSSLGRTVEAAVLDQQQSLRQLQQLQHQQTMGIATTCGDQRNNCNSSHHHRSAHSLRRRPSRQQQHEPPVLLTSPQQLQERCSPLRQLFSQSLSHSQAQSALLLQSQDRMAPQGPSGLAAESSPSTSTEQHQHQKKQLTTLLEFNTHNPSNHHSQRVLRMMSAFVASEEEMELHPPQPEEGNQNKIQCDNNRNQHHQHHHQQQQHRQQQTQQQEPEEGEGPEEGCEDDDMGDGECDCGMSFLQALQLLAADAVLGRHCTLVVMEYMDAGTLHQAITRGDFSARRSADQRPKLLALLLTAQELAQGMAHLHGLGILHGDLKPSNVLLKGSPWQFGPCTSALGPGGLPAGSPGRGCLTCTDPRGYTAKIADLGLARPCSGETAELSSDEWGALAYLAPEGAKGSCCKASDVYSFGVILWEMSAGVRPYLGLTTPQVLMGLVTGTLQLTWPSDGSLYGPLRSLAMACTDYNAAERPTFEVAARILARMVRHIRGASEPVRQRHSSALSVEAAAAAAATAAAGRSPSPGGGGRGARCAAKCVLNHASRSMPLCAPAAAAAAAAALKTSPVAHPPSLFGGTDNPRPGSRTPLTPTAISATFVAVS